MNSHPNPTNSDRLKLHEAIGATALIAFAAAGLVLSVAALAARCFAVDALDSLRKRKGDKNVQ